MPKPLNDFIFILLITLSKNKTKQSRLQVVFFLTSKEDFQRLFFSQILVALFRVYIETFSLHDLLRY